MTNNSQKVPFFTDINSCPLCKSDDNKIVMEGIKDDVIGAIDYDGLIYLCNSCSLAYFSPVLSADKIHMAYSGYYTQNQDNLEISSNAQFDRFLSLENIIYTDLKDYFLRKVF